MLISPQNNRLYDTRNFDLYRNVYAIYIDHKVLQYNKEKYKDDYEKIHINYTETQYLISISTNDTISNIDYQNGYKIIYGHFYNKQDLFLYKNTANGKIIGYNIKKCLRDKLYFNKDNNLLCSTSYKTLAQQVKYINSKENSSYNEKLEPLPLTYEYYDETLNLSDFVDMYTTNMSYIDKCITLIPLETKTIVQKL